MTEQSQARNTGQVVLPSGEELVGPGLYVDAATGPRSHAGQVAALRTGIDLGLTVVDTAAAYPLGGSMPHRAAGRGAAYASAAEELVAEAVRGRRDDVFLIGRLAVDGPSTQGTVRERILGACEESLRRLRTDRIDLYVVHRCDAVPLEEIVGAVNLLMTEGLVRHWGVAGFDLRDLVELTAVPGGTAVEVNQVDYDLARRDVEWDLLPRCRAARLPVLVQVPARLPGAAAGSGTALAHPALVTVAGRHRVSPGEVNLAWMLHRPGVYAVAEATDPQQVRHHREALGLRLTDADLAELDHAFPPPSGRPRSAGVSPPAGGPARPG